MNRGWLTIAALATALTVAGCGKKPKVVDPPQGRENDHFPRVYPTPSPTDVQSKPKKSEPPPGTPNLGSPNAVLSPDEDPSPVPTVGGFRFP